MIRPRTLVRVVLAVVFGSPASGVAQQTVPGHSAFSVGLDLGWSPNMADGFSNDQICPSGTAFSIGIRAGKLFNRWLGAEASGQYFFGNPPPDCVSGPVPPPPPSGPYTQVLEFYDDRIVGYGFGSLSARILFVPVRTTGSELRLHLGVGSIMSKGITTWQAGLTEVLGGGQVRFIMEGGLLWYDVPKRTTTAEYLDGSLVSAAESEFPVPERTLHIRAGILIYPRSRE